MRFAITFVVVALVLAPLPVQAYENFIPIGHNYSPDDQTLPELNSPQDRLNSQVDIYEADIWTRQRAAKAFSSRLDQFSNSQELKGGSTFIDY